MCEGMAKVWPPFLLKGREEGGEECPTKFYGGEGKDA